MTAKTTSRHRVLHVVKTGKFLLDDAERHFLDVIDSVKKHRCEKVLIDGRAVVGDPTIVERFYYGEFAASAMRRLKFSGAYDGDYPQFAYVLHEPVLDPLRFGETVMVNRGMNVRVFDNIDEAVRWLGLASEEI